ncbi:MAG: ABC transporter substrate-binding protein, partial [Rhodococcus fascians]
MRRNHVLSASALAVAAGLLLSACAGGSNTTSTFDENAEPVSGGTFTFGLNSDLDCVDPQQTGSSVAALVSRNVLDSLVGHTENNEFTPWLAESWEVSDDATSYTFSLRDGVTFSDGTPLDADAVKFNLDRIFDPATKSNYARSLLGPLREVTAVDPTTVRVDFTAPYPSFLQGASLPFLGIESPTHLRGTDNAECTTVVGSGPFVLESYTRQQGIRLVKRKDYNWSPAVLNHTGPAYLDRIELDFIAEALVRYSSLASGEYDFTTDAPPQNAATIRADSRLAFDSRVRKGAPNRGVTFNTERFPFDDVQVRRALALATDREGIARIIGFGEFRLKTDFLAANTSYYDPSFQSALAYNPDEANRLLDAAGWATR